MPVRYRDVSYAKIVQVANQEDAARELKRGVLVLVMPGSKPKWLKFVCPCGCDEIVSVNLMPAAAKAWRITYEEGWGISLWPSVWRDTGCESHFILRRNVARLLLGKSDDSETADDRGWWA